MNEQNNSEKQIVLTAGRQNLRLDKFLALQMPKLSRNAVKSLIEDGQVTIGGDKKKAHYIPKEGEKISVLMPAPKEKNSAPEAQELPVQIIYEDESVAVINKQAGLVVHPAAGHKDKTLVNALLFHIGELARLNALERQGIVHRLDRDTSGVMVVAKTEQAGESLARQFKEHSVKKNYIAITRGVPRTSSGTISLPIGRHQKKRKEMTVREDGREAVTEYKVIETFRDFALVELKPKTGRTHQIRVHLKSLGTPVLCDATYSRKPVIYESELRQEKRSADEKPLLARQALHAKSLTIIHPVTGKTRTFESALPQDMENTLAVLRTFCSPKV